MKNLKEQRDKKLKEKLEQKRKQIIANAKDAHFAEALTDDILSVKGQLDAEPIELEVRCKDVIKEYDFDTFAFKVCNNGILFQTKGGFSTFVEPRCMSLYDSLAKLLTMHDKQGGLSAEELSAEDKTTYEQYMSAWTHTLQIPVGASLSPVILFETATKYLQKFMEVSDDLMKQALKEETPEDHIKNAEAANVATVLDMMGEQVKDTDDGEKSDTSESVGEEEAKDKQ